LFLLRFSSSRIQAIDLALDRPFPARGLLRAPTKAAFAGLRFCPPACFGHGPIRRYQPRWITLSIHARSSRGGSDPTKGNDTLLIKNGHLNRKALRDAHMSPDDLKEDLREQGVENSHDVKEAGLERSGKLSVVRN